MNGTIRRPRVRNAAFSLGFLAIVSGSAAALAAPGVEALGARPIQTPQQSIQALPQGVPVAVRFVQRGQQFQDHPLEGGRVIRQVLRWR